MLTDGADTSGNVTSVLVTDGNRTIVVGNVDIEITTFPGDNKLPFTVSKLTEGKNETITFTVADDKITTATGTAQ